MSRDRVFLDGMVFYGYHGVNPEEQTLGQRFVVDLWVEFDLQQAGRSDALDDTVNYSRLFEVVRGVVEGPPRKLLEAVAEEIAQGILSAFPVTEVGVTLRKPGVAIKGSIMAAAGVEMTRRRDESLKEP